MSTKLPTKDQQELDRQAEAMKLEMAQSEVRQMQKIISDDVFAKESAKLSKELAELRKERVINEDERDSRDCVLIGLLESISEGIECENLVSAESALYAALFIMKRF